MNEELEVAPHKWKLTLTDSEIKNILDNSLKQLEMKTSFISGNQWKLSNKAIYNITGIDGEYSLPGDEDKLPKVFFTRTSDSWIVDSESKDDSVLLKDFLEVAKTEIINWAKTAVFYGVGSYKK
jgi:hypothetical protein